MQFPVEVNWFFFALQLSGGLLIFYIFARLLTMAIFKSYFEERIKFCFIMQSAAKEESNGTRQEEEEEEREAGQR